MREIYFGQFQGKLVAEMKDGYRSIQNEWYQGKLEIPVPDGESANDLIIRGHSAFRDAAMLGSLVAVVAHGGVIRWSIAAMEFDENTSVKESMASQRVRSVLAAHVGNCCCCVVLFDHATSKF